jgi:Exostosin family
VTDSLGTRFRVFSDRSYLHSDIPHVVLLYPFWGKNPEDPNAPDSGRFDQYQSSGQNMFEMTSLQESECAVLPFAWEHAVRDTALFDTARRFCERARSHGRKTAIFFVSDLSTPVDIEDSVIFRTSSFRSRRRQNEYAVPGWSEDFVDRYLGGRLPVRDKPIRATVGFCGLIAKEGRSKWRDVLGRSNRIRLACGTGQRFETPSNQGHILRGEAIEILRSARGIDTNFVVRKEFLGGSIGPDGRTDMSIQRHVRAEFLQNLIDSDYALCVRGAGNFSYRLYEAMSLGRIPIFVDTDCVLPYDFHVDWKQYCVWVDSTDLPSIGEKIADFHAGISAARFRELQHACRELWQNWLSPEGYFANLYRHFELQA